MQFATQSQAKTLGYYPFDFSCLAHIDTDIPSLSLDPSSTTGDQAWDGSLMAALEYAALAGAQASGSMVLPTSSFRPMVAPHSDLGYDTSISPSYVSGFGTHVAAQIPGVSYASTPGDDLLWGNCDSGISAEETVDFESWSGITGTPSSLLAAAGPVVDLIQALYPAQLSQGSYQSTQAFAPCETACGAYVISSNQSPSIASPTSDWASIFSPAASLLSQEAALTASSSSFPSPEPTTLALSSPASNNLRSRKATAHVGRVRSSASRPPKPSHSTLSLASGRVRTTASRNKQISADEIKGSVCREGTYFCSNCSYRTRRRGDMLRHVQTHSDIREFVCCGVPVEDAPGYIGKNRYHEGREMVGGCRKAFKRKDSFLRHLQASDGECIRPVYLVSS